MMTFYRLCRAWHGYLSAVAFVWLLFFSVTGILLNHPTWLRDDKPATVSRQFRLQPKELASVTTQTEPGPALVQAMRGRLGLKGQVDSSAVAGQLLFVRMRGASGSSELQLDLQSGQGSAAIESFPVPTLFKELHRGEKAGAVWRAMIDIAGFALVVTSLLGLMIYLSLRFRLHTALFLMAGGLAAMAAGIMLIVD
ncbi:hypothetical protein AYO42_01810 [Rhizomicrobium sp. SCGC AG-212-E05]|nr:hypothetical protein AYO42_01810 [Rhizomicrobium sp. SCGC AG-212-E05]